jgi:FkbM family methyltransferase
MKSIKIVFIIFMNIVHNIFRNEVIDRRFSNFITGESFVIRKVLKKYIRTENPVFFDVGSNEGNYSLLLLNEFPNSVIYAFEANHFTFKKMSESIVSKKINFFNIGLSSSIGKGLIYDYKNNAGSEHASVYKEVITETHESAECLEINFEKDTIDNFCYKKGIERINFIKVDTEGSEFDILQGGKQMIGNDKIDIIQFEFNEMNVVSRVFLKDYYDFLKNYNIYRIEFFGLVPLPKYRAVNEIFKYQNFLAINKKIIK